MAEVEYLRCTRCGKCVSTGFWSVPTDTPDRGVIVRAWVECPECFDAIARESAVADLLRAMKCEWTVDADGNWDTACGRKFYFDDSGTPADHHFHFCYACGGRLTVALPAAPEREETR